ncbi:MAG: hypothetical protein KAJ19_22090, partial [Gammaproteobacteria bacterium]|nr:hypothetical protein [Gammaproteobacteria bacterium]
PAGVAMNTKQIDYACECGAYLFIKISIGCGDETRIIKCVQCQIKEQEEIHEQRILREAVEGCFKR